MRSRRRSLRGRSTRGRVANLRRRRRGAAGRRRRSARSVRPIRIGFRRA